MFQQGFFTYVLLWAGVQNILYTQGNEGLMCTFKLVLLLEVSRKPNSQDWPLEGKSSFTNIPLSFSLSHFKTWPV